MSEVRAVIPYWRAVYEVARKDVILFARTKRLYVMGALYSLGFILLPLGVASVFNDLFGVGDSFRFGSVEISRANIVMAIYLGIPLVGGAGFLQFLGIVFTFDAIVREYEDRSLFLLLAKPVSRSAFVLGKFLGAVTAVGTVFVVIGTVSYFIVMMVVAQFPSPGDFLRYYQALGIILLGLVALASMTLFGSSFARTTTMSMLFALGMWIAVLEILAQAPQLYWQVTRPTEPQPWWVELFQYMNPSTSIGPALQVLLNADAFREAGVDFNLFGFRGLGLEPWLSIVSLTVFTAVFLGGSILVMARRNFE